MTFVTHQTDAPSLQMGKAVWTPARRAILVTATVIAVFGAFAVGRTTVDAGQPQEVEASLVTLLRFMAMLKLIMALAALALSYWRLGHPASQKLAVSYIVATVLMACGPGLIWHMSMVAYGALLFHIGLLSFVVLASRDDASYRIAMPAAVARIRAAAKP